VAELISAWNKQIFEQASTVDEDSEVAGFLSFLHSEGVLTRPQLRGLSSILESTLTSAPKDPLAGLRFGDFTTVEKLGEGAMGQIYLATKQGEVQANYVVKVYAPPADDQEVERIRREGELLSQLEHPNIVRCYGSGKEGLRYYLVMEYVAGLTLQALMERRRRLPWEAATRVMLQVAGALRAVHEKGMVHRDVKPHNVLIARDGTVKLCDFGLAKASAEVHVRSTAGMILGSPAYIAPEQWGDHDVDERADLFALGVCYYFMISGVFPFRGRGAAEYAVRIQRGEFPPLETLSPGLPVGVSWIVTQLLERDRRYRIPSARSLLRDLDRVLRGDPPEPPRLEGPRGATFPLIGRDLFRVGRDSKCELWLNHPSLAEIHVHLVRTMTGLLLRTVADEGHVEVSGQRVQGESEVVLKTEDKVRFGSGEPWVYHEGNLGKDTRKRSTSGHYKTLTQEGVTGLELPGIVLDALSDGGHPLAILACIEELNSRNMTSHVERGVRAALVQGVPPTLAPRAANRARQIGLQRREWISNCLFQTTYENLGPNANKWLTWWWDARERYAVQGRPSEPRTQAVLEITTPDGKREAVLEDGREEWTLGRSLQAEISIRDNSVSRAHARLLRLSRGYAYRDLGSRQGIRVEGDRADIGLLTPGDTLQLGRVTVGFDLRIDETPLRTGDPCGVDRLTFTALVELRAPQVVSALIALLDRDGLYARYSPQLEKHAPGAGEALLGPFLDAQRLMAADALPSLSRGALREADAATWLDWWNKQRGGYPPQVYPWGWPRA
jgi:serine/threonine protein kinase/pSer/pThr/pTyr-binding forkhead associated (FHA) protein